VRKHPFTGGHTFHHGIDLAAPEGSEVKPARAGIVTEKGFDPILGNFLVIGHEGGYETVYGHLNFSTVELKMRVGSDTIIGVVGSTGLSTGPHLHFEIRQGGESRDPEIMLPEIRG
jgi:murein DD-endopeptidase MepM/ murein hydrolase activator NlpD